MKTSGTTAQKLPPRSPIRLPDAPDREYDARRSQYRQLFHEGLSSDLVRHLDAPETTLVTADGWLVSCEEFDSAVSHYPELMVAFDVDPQLDEDQNGYIISEQGKPPDFVLEVGSESTGASDVGEKRDYYLSLGIGEYWRFDPTEDGRHHGQRLAADILVDGVYKAACIESLPGGDLRGYSEALGLYLHWEEGHLAFYSPGAGLPIPSAESERARRIAAEAKHAARVADIARAEAAEARIRELEELLRRQEA